jgi:hypothetical protein
MGSDMQSLTRNGGALRRAVVLGVFMASSASVVACSRKLTQEDCDGFLGRGIGLLAVASASEEPFTVESVRLRARPVEKKAIAELDAMCVGAADDGQRECSRIAHTIGELEKCGPLTKKARAVAEIAQNALPKRHGADECSKYGQHAVAIGASTVDAVGEVVRECDGYMNVGIFNCRMTAKDAAGWKACE